MILGAPLSVGGDLWKCMLPITLGNAVGGALFVGAYNWWAFMYCEDKSKAKDRPDLWEMQKVMELLEFNNRDLGGKVLMLPLCPTNYEFCYVALDYG